MSVLFNLNLLKDYCFKEEAKSYRLS